MLLLTQNPGDSLLPRPATRVSKFVSILQERGKRSKTSADRNDRVIPGSGMSQERDTIPAISGNANPGIAMTCAASE
jgi:hypothetical protein